MKIKRKITLIALLSFAFVLASCGGSEDRKAKYLEEGISKYNEENFDKARISFKNVLQIDPKDIEGRFWMGKTMEEQKEWRKAAGYYNAVLELSPEHRDALARLGRIMVMAREDKLALEKAELLLKKNPNDADGLVIRGGVHSIRGDITNAEADVKAALKSDPNHMDAIVLLSSIHNRNGDIEASLDVIDKGLAFHKKAINLRALKSNLLIKMKRVDEAVSVLEEIISIEPDDLKHRRNLVSVLVKLDRKEHAGQVLQQATKDMPDNIQAKIMLIEYLRSIEGQEKAEAKLNEMIASFPDKYELKFALGKLYEIAKKTDKAVEVYKGIISEEKTSPNGLKARNKLAVIYASQKDIDSALKQIKVVLEENPRDNDALILRGNISLIKKDIDSAIADYRSVLRDSPDSAAVLKTLARAQVANKEYELAKQNYIRAIEADATMAEVYPELAQLHINSKELEQAISTLEQGLMVSKDQKAMLSALTKLYIQTKNWEEAEKASTHMVVNTPDDPTGYHYRGLIALGKGKFKESEVHFREALSRAPGAVEPLNGLVRSYLNLKKPDLAIAWLERAIEKNPKHMVAYNLLGEVLLGQKQFKKARENFEKAISLKQDWWIPHRRIAESWVIEGEDKKAIEVYRNVLKKNEKAEKIRLDLAILLERAGHPEDAIKEYETLFENNRNPVIANNLATMLATHRSDEKSYKKALELTKIFAGADKPAFLDTLGWVSLKNNNIKDAVRNLERAVDMAPQAAIIRYHLGMAYLEDNQKELAKVQLQKSIDSGVKFTGIDVAKSTLSKLN